MIKPLKEYPQSDGFFFVCDIENDPTGAVLSIDSAWRGSNGIIIHIMHDDWSQWIDWLMPLAREDKRFRTVYAHNGGGWDWLSLANYLLTDGRSKRQLITAACAASKMIVMDAQIERKFTIHFCDSFQLLRSSLDKLATKFLGEGKADTGGLLPHEMEREKMLAYQRKDTELLLRVLEVTLELIREKVAKISTFGRTVGGTAMKVFRTIGLTEPITIPWKVDEKEFFRKGYAGGRVEVIKYGYFPMVNVYDVNSLYPYAMMTTSVPISDRCIPVSEIDPDSVGVYEIEFEQRNKSIMPVLTWGGKGIYSGHGTWYSPEINCLRRHDSSATIRLVQGYEFMDTGKVFQECVQRLYSLRLLDYDGPLSLLCKFLLNSLYGKFGQKSIRESIVVFDDMNILFESIPMEGASYPVVLDEDLGTHKLTLESECPHEHVPIAAMITSAARVCLYEGLVHAARLGTLVYCDTDSVHTTGVLPAEMVGKNIGQFKVEFSGEACYAGKKLYALRNSKGEKVRAKGVSVGARNGFNLRFNDLRRICDGESVTTEFSQPTTALQVFKLLQPCKFSTRKRTLKRT